MEGGTGYEWEIRDDDSRIPLVVDMCLLYGRCPGEYRCWIKHDESGYHQGSPFDFTLKRKSKLSGLLLMIMMIIIMYEQPPFSPEGHCMMISVMMVSG